MDEQRIREIVREEIIKLANEEAVAETAALVDKISDQLSVRLQRHLSHDGIPV